MQYAVESSWAGGVTDTKTDLREQAEEADLQTA